MSFIFTTKPLIVNHAHVFFLYNSYKHDEIILVGGLNPSEKYEFVNWDD